jgi:hypothetical protein
VRTAKYGSVPRPSRKRREIRAAKNSSRFDDRPDREESETLEDRKILPLGLPQHSAVEPQPRELLRCFHPDVVTHRLDPSLRRGPSARA